MTWRWKSASRRNSRKRFLTSQSIAMPVSVTAASGRGRTGLKRLRGGRVIEACTEHKEEGGRKPQRECDACLPRGQCSLVALSLRRK